jgi:hypothetical protein
MRPGHAEYTSSNEGVECANLSRAGAAAVATAAWRAHDRRRAASGPARRALDLHSFAPAPDATVRAVEPAAAYEHCRLLTRRIACTFNYGSRFLPLEKRRAAWALYAFCRGAIVFNSARDDAASKGAAPATRCSCTGRHVGLPFRVHVC